MNTITQTGQQVKQVDFKDGAHFDPAVNEWVVNDVAWSSTQAQAWTTYHEMLRVNREHTQRNPANNDSIIFASFAFEGGEVAIWESCPDCGRVRDVGEPCLDCDIPFLGEPVYGEGYELEARW